MPIVHQNNIDRESGRNVRYTTEASKLPLNDLLPSNQERCCFESQKDSDSSQESRFVNGEQLFETALKDLPVEAHMALDALDYITDHLRRDEEYKKVRILDFLREWIATQKN